MLSYYTKPKKKAFDTLQRICNQISYWEAWLALQHLLDWSAILFFAISDFDQHLKSKFQIKVWLLCQARGHTPIKLSTLNYSVLFLPHSTFG